MKGCKALQVILGIICALGTIAIGAVTVLLLLPYLGGTLTDGIFQHIYDGIKAIASTVGVAGREWIVIGVVFALPTLLLVLATNLLFYGKRASSIKAGVAFADIAIVICCGALAWFREEIFASYQQIALIALASIGGFALLLTIIANAVVNHAKKKARATVAPTADQGNVDQTITVEETGDNNVDTASETTTDTTDVAVDEAPQEDEGILYMAQDYSSVSEVAEETYDHNDVLPRNVLEKLKIARDLYEKGAITKEEYLAIVNKYLS